MAGTDDAGVEAFFDSFAHDSSQPLRPAGASAPVMEAGTAEIRPSSASEDMALAMSADRMLRNVEGVCETFERLQRQFAALEHSCENLC